MAQRPRDTDHMTTNQTTDPYLESVLADYPEDPPIHPALIEHLRAVMARPDPNLISHAPLHAGLSLGDVALWAAAEQTGREAVIAYLERLLSSKGDQTNELQQAQDQGPDARRPSPRIRGR